MGFTRRQLMAVAAGTAGITALAGCTDGEGSSGTESGRTSAASSFFVFGDVTAEVAGDVAAADLLVPVGQHGHGWEPGPRVRADIRDADLFVHGMEGFQPWVDGIVGDLAADGADVTTVDASRDVDLLPADGEHEEHESGDGDHDGHDETHTTDHDGHDETHTTEHDGHNETHTTEHDGHNETHTTEHDGHNETHTTEHEGTHTGEEHDEHDHGSVDPHFWMDPTRVVDAVDTIEAALAEADGDNADAYAENAESFRTALTDLDARIEETVAAGGTDTLLVAGHDSFGYFEDRYGVHVEALTNVSPDDQPTTRDIQHAQEVIAEHDLQYVCADPLESQEAAEQLVAETDAEAVLPLTAMPGLTEEWEAEGWGYVDVMTEVNLPTLERGLDA
ncbi:hypothetical protein JCM30237_28960 [Halolamina litorea]|uniref:Metal ABC transporter solute-binding protein, Zn/Mn family n=1 Tax=Halolamina litorea TaxID=1515593 RepID=A0ABD6BSU4_9EURY|nr:zinc ABC transporter substrate-binding protein [Halolamina litorea]